MKPLKASTTFFSPNHSCDGKVFLSNSTSSRLRGGVVMNLHINFIGYRRTQRPKIVHGSGPMHADIIRFGNEFQVRT